MDQAKMMDKIKQISCSVVWLLLLLAGCGRVPRESVITQAITSTPSTTQTDAFLAARLDMVERTIVARGVNNSDVLRAVQTVPRHEFVLPDYVDQAYEDHPLPIGYGQTISQPYIVAWMTELLELKEGEKVLEIGTGSGYQAAILAEVGGLDVYSIEIVPELAERAKAQLNTLDYTQIHLKSGDGYYGWPEYAPFDAIIVTAAPDHLPAPLARQLKQGGRLVIPIGPPGSYQTLWKFVQAEDGLKAQSLGGVAFVPLTGGAASDSAPSIPTP